MNSTACSASPLRVKGCLLVKTYRRRYIAFRLTSTIAYSREGIVGALTRTAFALNNDEPPHDIKYIRVIDYDVETGLGILRCNHRLVDILRSSFKEISPSSLGVLESKVLGVSGTLKALRQKFLQARR